MPWIVPALPYIAAAGAVAGGGVAAYSSYESGQQAAALAKYNSANQQAQDQALLQQSAAKSLAQREENDRILAEQRAGFAASGVATGTGSPLTVEARQSALLERRALNTEYEGELSYRTGQTAAYGMEMQGAAAKKAGALNAGATLLQGVSSAANDIYG